MTATDERAVGEPSPAREQDADGGSSTAEGTAADAGSTADEFVEQPVPLGVGVAVGFALLASLALATAPVALAAGVVGVLVLAVGAHRGVYPLVGLGFGTLLIGVVVAGLGGTAAELLVLATAGAVLAWDTARQAIDLGATVGRDGEARRALLVHVSVVFATITVVGSFGYAVFQLATGGRPTTSLVLLLFGAFLLVVILR